MPWWMRTGTDTTQEDAQEPCIVAVFQAFHEVGVAFIGNVSAILMASSRSMDGAIWRISCALARVSPGLAAVLLA